MTVTALPILKTNKEPTFLNDYASAGALLGTLAFPVIGTAVGGLIGGGYGRHRMAEDQVHGKKLRNPSAWNMKVFTGVAKGLALGLGILAATAIFQLPLLFAVAGGVITLAGPVAGGMRAGQSGKAEMESELSEAQSQQIQQEKLEKAHAHLKSKEQGEQAPSEAYHPAHEAEKRGYRHSEAVTQRREQVVSSQKVH